VDGGDLGGLSRSVDFTVAQSGTAAVILEDTKGCKVGDVNCDGKVNLVDLSILLYWYKNPIPPASVDLNKDGVVNIVDFSILVYRWTA
jgi:hypothetical protein